MTWTHWTIAPEFYVSRAIGAAAWPRGVHASI